MTENVTFYFSRSVVNNVLVVFIKRLHLLEHLVCNFVQRSHLIGCDCNLDVVQSPDDGLEL